MSKANSMSIMQRNNDCLLHIFKFITLSNRPNLELVCKRWLEVTSLLWNVTFIFNVADKDQLEYTFKEPNKFGECPLDYVNVSLCKRIFPKCFNSLKVINLSRLHYIGNVTMSSCFYCMMRCGADGPGLLNDLVVQLLNCANLRKLSLCFCVVKMSDATLAHLFQKNEYLHSLTLCGYDLVGECLIGLNLKSLESINFVECYLKKPSYLNTVISNGSGLHTIRIDSCLSINSVDETFKIISQTPLVLRRLSVYELCSGANFAIDICSFQNLVVLGIEGSALKDHELKLIAQNCVKLLVLLISMNSFFTDEGLSNIVSLSQLEVLNIGDNDNFTDLGLKVLNRNSRVLQVSRLNFSAAALLLAIEEIKLLEQLDVENCEHIETNFVESVIDIVNKRQNRLPLEIGVFRSSIDVEKVKDTDSLVKLTNKLEVDYNKYD
ncbi:hypothetical protein QAD02_014972 [Eretmocerus hayati]|uniref:Uncharacterized protein n=1 Tax=Eretmocerus hayati TaxID=131215 RepID=A0ACC2PBQ8_9HYME|nr:hypothetical protein QAD02_014972 [Eretmocerus hayati]